MGLYFHSEWCQYHQMPMTKLLCGLDGSGRYCILVYIMPSAMKAAMKLFSNPLFVTQL